MPTEAEDAPPVTARTRCPPFALGEAALPVSIIFLGGGMCAPPDEVLDMAECVRSAPPVGRGSPDTRWPAAVEGAPSEDCEDRLSIDDILVLKAGRQLSLLLTILPELDVFAGTMCRMSLFSSVGPLPLVDVVVILATPYRERLLELSWRVLLMAGTECREGRCGKETRSTGRGEVGCVGLSLSTTRARKSRDHLLGTPSHLPAAAVPLRFERSAIFPLLLFKLRHASRPSDAQ